MTTAFVDQRNYGAALSCPRPQNDAGIRLVCFPHSGGGPELYRPWADALAPDIEVWTVTLPGHGRRWREPFVADWQYLIAELARAISSNVPQPIALFGHSLGALLAYETAHLLTGPLQPIHLFVSARAHPAHTFRIEIPEDDGELLALVDDVYRGVPEPIKNNPELARNFVPALRADLELGANYVHRPNRMVPVPITALGGVDDATVAADDLAMWREYTSDGFTWRQFPGDHFYLRPSETGVLRTVRSRLARRSTGSMP